MKISKNTLEVLKNFASINQNIMISEGKFLHTRSVGKNMYACADVDTEFPATFGIYNLSQFLGVVSLFSEPELEFGESSVTIAQGKNRVTYRYAAAEVLEFPDKVIKERDADAQFTLTEENLKSLLKAGAVLSSTDLLIQGDGENIVCTVLDPKNTSSNTFSVDVGTTDREFKVYIKLENIKLLGGNYEVSLSSKKIAKFANTGSSYSLHVANEKDSSWS